MFANKKPKIEGPFRQDANYYILINFTNGEYCIHWFNEEACPLHINSTFRKLKMPLGWYRMGRHD